MKLQKKQLDLEHHTSQKADAPPSYEKVVIETWTLVSLFLDRLNKLSVFYLS